MNKLIYDAFNSNAYKYITVDFLLLHTFMKQTVVIVAVFNIFSDKEIVRKMLLNWNFNFSNQNESSFNLTFFSFFLAVVNL